MRLVKWAVLYWPDPISCFSVQTDAIGVVAVRVQFYTRFNPCRAWEYTFDSRWSRPPDCRGCPDGGGDGHFAVSGCTCQVSGPARCSHPADRLGAGGLWRDPDLAVCPASGGAARIDAAKSAVSSFSRHVFDQRHLHVLFIADLSAHRRCAGVVFCAAVDRDNPVSTGVARTRRPAPLGGRCSGFHRHFDHHPPRFCRCEPRQPVGFGGRRVPWYLLCDERQDRGPGAANGDYLSNQCRRNRIDFRFNALCLDRPKPRAMGDVCRIGTDRQSGAFSDLKRLSAGRSLAARPFGLY